MTSTKVWMITGATRGMGLSFAKEALAVGHQVVATGRNPAAINEVIGETDQLLAVRLDVTSTADARAAVDAAVGRFGRVDVLVNNAGASSRATSRRCHRSRSNSSWRPTSSAR